MRPLQEYIRKRNFRQTPEPGAVVKKGKAKKLIFVIQEHHASHLHYDFRLEMEGVLKSWSVPKGPSLDPKQKRLAVEVEDHPIAYAKFKGVIPENQYGAGNVYIWDEGTWEPEGDPMEALEKGRIEFELKGKRLHGRWVLIRTRSTTSGKPQWLLIKRTDEYVEAGHTAEIIGEDREKKSKKAKAITTVKTPVKKSRSEKKTSSARREMPEFIAPELAELVTEPPSGEAWVHEAKFDGYRIQARIENGRCQLLTRTGQDWTERYPKIAASLEKLQVVNAIFDGEVVWLEDNGQTNFQKLQNALQDRENGSIKYYAFDLLYLENQDMRSLPLLERKSALENLLSTMTGEPVLYSAHFDVEGDQFLKASCDMQLEGIISKKVDAPYFSGRNENWVKSKCKMRQEFVIGGYTVGQGTRSGGFGALLLGLYEEGKLRFVGKVGTGFNAESVRELKKQLTKIEQDKNPFDVRSPKEKNVHWVKPKMVAEIAFANWTNDKILRVPVFQGIREDKPATQIKLEQPKETALVESHLKAVKKKGVKGAPQSKRELVEEVQGLTHPERVLFEDEGITKLELARYYQEVHPWMLPHVVGRPLTIMRCPEGNDGTCFLQKHYKEGMPEGIHPITVKEKAGRADYMSIDSEEGLVGLVQQGSLEIHCWSSRAPHLLKPDQMIFDFDQGPDVSWKQVVKSVFEVKRLLEDLKLESFCKLTGGKGVHIHVPIEPIYSWDQIKNFTSTIAHEMVSRNPDLYTAKMSKTIRDERIFIDYLRNAMGSTAVAPYSLRAKKTSAVALPLTWKELADVESSNEFTLEKALKKIKSRKADPWKGYSELKQRIAILDESNKKTKSVKRR